MELNGHTEVFVSDEAQGKHVIRELYDGKLVVTAHCTRFVDDPNWADDLTRKLDRFMRDNHLSRLEAYWNAVPPEDNT